MSSAIEHHTDLSGGLFAMARSHREFLRKTANQLQPLCGAPGVDLDTATARMLAVSFALMYAVKATGTLRVSREGEIEGLDIHEHGMPAYPEYVIHGYDPTPHAVARAAAERAPAKALAPLTTGRA